MLWFKIHPHEYYNAQSISQSPYSLVAKTNQRVLFCFFYLWKASTELISLCYAKLSCYVTHSKKLNIIRLNSKMLKYEQWDEERYVWDMMEALFRKQQALCLRDSLHNNHISMETNLSKTFMKKSMQSCQVKCLDMRWCTAVQQSVWFQGQNCFSISLFYLPDVHSALHFTYFYFTKMFLAVCHVWPHLGRVTGERQKLKEQIHLTG